MIVVERVWAQQDLMRHLDRHKFIGNIQAVPTDGGRRGAAAGTDVGCFTVSSAACSFW